MTLKKACFGTLVAACFVAGSVVSQPAAAQHWHGGGGWHGGWHGGWGVGIAIAPGYWGPGYWGPGWGAWGYGPWYDYPGYYYPPAVAVAPSSPPVYVERSDTNGAQVQSSGNYWYHCENPSGYYPYVKQCPGGWQRVAPQPPNAQ